MKLCMHNQPSKLILLQMNPATRTYVVNARLKHLSLEDIILYNIILNPPNLYPNVRTAVQSRPL